VGGNRVKSWTAREKNHLDQESGGGDVWSSSFQSVSESTSVPGKSTRTVSFSPFSDLVDFYFAAAGGNLNVLSCFLRIGGHSILFLPLSRILPLR
jgi:hypothetical protein